MFSLFKSMSRSVHDEPPHDDTDHQPEYFKTDGACQTFTVWRKSLVVTCNGFTVIDSKGELVYRVDNYVGRPPEELVLMDGSGNPVLTMHRCYNRLGLANGWMIYEGETGDYCGNRKNKLYSEIDKPIWYAKKNMNMNILNSDDSNVLAYVYRRPSDKKCRYVIEGSYRHRSCKVITEDESKKVVAEIKRKEAHINGVCFGLDVFELVVDSGLDCDFAMGIVLLLDRMFSP